MGTYLVAAELTRRGLIAVVTSRNTKGTDILVEDPRTGALASVQVKANRSSFGSWLVGDPQLVIGAENRFFALVNIRKDRNEFFVLPSGVLAKMTNTYPRKNGIWYSVEQKELEGYRDRWDQIDESFKRA